MKSSPHSAPHPVPRHAPCRSLMGSLLLGLEGGILQPHAPSSTSLLSAASSDHADSPFRWGGEGRAARVGCWALYSCHVCAICWAQVHVLQCIGRSGPRLQGILIPPLPAGPAAARTRLLWPLPWRGAPSSQCPRCRESTSHGRSPPHRCDRVDQGV
jgi:hypothetical protein